MTEHQKRSAFEPGAGLLERTTYEPDMKRPVAIIAGASLVLIRVIDSALWLAEIAGNWDRHRSGLRIALDGTLAWQGLAEAGPAVLVGVNVAFLALQVVLAVLILRGVNWPRVAVMIVAVASITSVMLNWATDDIEITLRTSLVAVALDILILLALSSRSAAAYARRNEVH